MFSFDKLIKTDADINGYGPLDVIVCFTFRKPRFVTPSANEPPLTNFDVLLLCYFLFDSQKTKIRERK